MVFRGRHIILAATCAAVLLFSCHTSRRDRPIDEPVISSRNDKPLSTEAYIAKYKDLAVWQMHHFGVPASITMAQAILESNSGNSELAKSAKNHFGIKCTSTWKGKTYLKDDEKNSECFRMYSSEAESFQDHIDFLKRDRYAALFSLSSRDYKGWAKGLKKAGYATNPKYPDLLINLIDRYKLYELDNMKPGKHGKTARAGDHNDIYN